MIEPIVRKLVATHPGPSLDDLLGFVLDAEHAFAQPRFFDSSTVATTDDPTSRLDVSVTLDDATPTLADVRRSLDRVWTELAYSHFQATSCQFHDDATVFRFVTVIALRHHFVTGTVLVTGPRYPVLSRAYQLDFGPLTGTPRRVLRRFG